MSDLHTSVLMEDLVDGKNDRSTLRESSPNRSSRPGSKRRAARAVSEAEEDGNDEGPDVLDPSEGVDDGLLDNKHKPDKPTFPNGDGVNTNESNGGIPKRRPSFPYPDIHTPRTIVVDGIETQVPDLNAYQHKKTLAQGMMDLALLSANANQLRYVLESYNRHPYFYPSLIFISLSIIFQVAVGVGLILNSQYNIKDDREICKANRISNLTIIGIFIITVVNVFISSFGVADAPPTP